MGNAVIPLIMVTTGGVLVWAGITDPQGGVFSGLNTLMKGGKTTPRKGTKGWTGLTTMTGMKGMSGTTGTGPKVGRPKGGTGPKVTGPRGGTTGLAGTTGLNTGVDWTQGRKDLRGNVLYESAQWLGVPYLWGGNTKRGVDCSGLTKAAYKAAYIDLPRVSQMQAVKGTAVSQAQARPGDLVWFGAPVHHVGIYLGGGRMRHAPKPGAVVRDEKIWTWERYGFRSLL